MPGGLISSPVGGEGGARSRPAPPPQRCVSPAGSRKIQPLARRALLLYDDDDDDDDIVQNNFPVRLFSCLGQLNRGHCHSVSQSLN